MNTVLVATERDLEQNVLAQALDGRGYEIIRSRDGLDALEAARNRNPQVLLVNVALPKLDGFALYRRFQQDDQLRHIPVVLFSTRSNDQKSERFAMELGAVRFVGNALKPGALNGVIEAALASPPAPNLPNIQQLKPAAPVPVVSKGRAALAAVPRSETPVNIAPAAPVAIDRTARLPALIALPDTEQLAQLHAEQQQLQQSLQATQQQLAGAQEWRELFGLSPVAMWLVNRTTQKIMAVNAAALKLFAYSHDEFMQLDSPALLRDQAQPAGTTHVFGFRSKDGRGLSLLVNSAELSMDGQPAELWIAHDVGYRVRGERAMADEVQRVKALLAALPVAYCVIDAEARLRDLNPACTVLLGVGREQVLEQFLDGVLTDPQQLAALKNLAAGQSLVASVRQGDGGQRSIQFTAGQQAFGAGLRLLVLQPEREPATVEIRQAVTAPSRLPLVLEVLRYADDADEPTLLQYAMAQLANAFDSSLALFASLERITQTLDLVAINHAQSHRRPGNGNLPIPTPWLGLLAQRATTIAAVPEETLELEGLPAITSYAACVVNTGRESWLLVVANRDAAYSLVEQRELQECAEILVATLMRKRQQSRLLAQVQRSAASTESMLGLLEKIMDSHDAYAAGSGQRVASLALALGKQLGLSEPQCVALGLAARLHDVGHLSLPASLLLQPTALNDAERTLMQGHVAYGVRLLNGVDLGADVAGIVEQHHERLDGSGYPAQLAGAQIRMEARILAVADVMEALVARRPYRAAFSTQAALAELRCSAGQQFDSDVVNACEAVFAAHKGQWPH